MMERMTFWDSPSVAGYSGSTFPALPAPSALVPSTTYSRGWSWRPWKNRTGPVTSRMSACRGEATKRFAGFAHRFHKTPDLVLFLTVLAEALQRHGTLGALFRECHDPKDADIGPSLTRFVTQLRNGRDEASLRYLLTSPADGSACKRMNLYLRWMVRRTSPDVGLWTFVSPAQLVMPVDTHIHRIATFLGLNDRKSADWRAAREITDALARFDAADPVRYDFALCRLGILDLCSRTRKKESCDVCQLRDVCRFPVTETTTGNSKKPAPRSNPLESKRRPSRIRTPIQVVESRG